MCGYPEGKYDGECSIEISIARYFFVFGLAECRRKILGKGWVPKLIKYIFESGLESEEMEYCENARTKNFD